jgi:GDP-L-fucose synthase
MGILVLGHTGFLGGAVYKRLIAQGNSVFGASKSTGTDLREPDSLKAILNSGRYEVIINCAAHVGGIEYGRKNPVALYRDNLLMNLNILSAASESNSKLINPISNCAYPRDLDIFSEDKFWDGELDKSVLVYGGIRKLGWIGAWAYSQELGLKSANLIFPNLFGPNDHLDPVRAHALGALVFRFLEAKKLGTPNVVVWGSGSPIREWLYVEDAVDAMLLAVENDINCSPLNIGSGIGISIRELAEKIASAIGYEGSIVYDKSKQDGAPKKIMDARKTAAELGWKPKTSFESGLIETIKSYQARM